MDIPKQTTRSNQENKRILSRFYSTKEEFLREYEKLDGKGSEVKEFYLLVLTELEQAVSVGDIDSFKRLGTLIDYTSDLNDSVTLSDYYDNANNSIRNSNLIILVSKHNKVHILQYLLEGDSKVLYNLSIGIGKSAILPEDVDEESHNAFYYAIRSGNTQLLDILIKKWPDNYFKASSEELEEVFSRAYDELRLKNVPLSEEMEGFVENELINLRFFSNASGQDQSPWGDIAQTRERIQLVLEFVEFLKENYSKTEEEVDGRFIFVAKCIAQNIHILKQRLKSTYDKLPWEEMEFCLVIFISSCTKQQELNLFYCATLNKTKILKYLENFANELGNKEDITKGDKLYCLPRGQKRENVVANIIRTCPQFEELYNDYQQIRDIYSLEKINDNIKLASLADPQEKEGQLVITRVLQIIGEHIKNTLESPKLSHITSELLVLSVRNSTRTIIVDIRDAISHADALSTRIQIEEKADCSLFINIQDDIKKIGDVISDILYKIKIKIMRILLTNIVTSENLDEIKEVFQELNNTDFVKLRRSENFKMTKQEKVEKLVKELDDNIADKSDYENELFNKINSEIRCAGTESENIRHDYVVVSEILLAFSRIFSDNKTNPIGMNFIRTMKLSASVTLQNIDSKIKNGRLLEMSMLLKKIIRCVGPRLSDDKLQKIKKLIFGINFYVQFKMDCMSWIEELREQLSEKDSPNRTRQQRKAYNLSKDPKDQNLLARKLTELKTILCKNSLTGPLANALGFYKKDKKMEAAVEMLVLDIMTILGSSKNSLQNNLLFLDDGTPLLNGKCLRNHLAHNNTIVDVLSDPSRAVLLNAHKFIEETTLTNERKIGKLVREDSVKLREKFYQSVFTITNQERMFVALEEGDLDSVQDCLLKGADIKARSISLSTAWHFAAKGSSLEVVKFILGHNLSANLKDNDGQTPLHIAAAYGRQNIVDFFLTEAGLCVDVLTKHSKAPLHFAAKNGHKDAVKILLKNKANTSTYDVRGLLPLHHAIINNHIDVVKSLLENEINVDINETMGGSTPLHVAAEHGHLELVNFFLKMEVNVNVTTDENVTPLHLAASNSHVEVVKALILKGANVNSRGINYYTPLHNAIQCGNLEITNVLLQHGAYVNSGVFAAEDITPLHLATKMGYLEIVATLVENGADVDATGRKCCTPLSFAASYGRPEIAALLIEKGAEINVKGYNNLTALHVAAMKGHKDVADVLIKSKAEVKTQDVFHDLTPLHDAAGNGNKDIIDILIKNGADVNFKSVFGYTPLHIAVQEGHEAAVDFLIKNKAEVNAKNNIGVTPLHLAVIQNHKNIVKLLIVKEAHVHEEGAVDCTPLHTAAYEGHKEIVEILISHGAKVNDMHYAVTPLDQAMASNQKEIVEVLLANGANISLEDINAWFTPVIAGNKDIVEMFLKNQDYVNYKNSDHYTPLHFAAAGGYQRIAKILIRNGADIDAVTIINVTPLSLAAQRGYEEVVKMLLACGANVNINAQANVTPLQFAAMEGHSNVVKVFLDHQVDINVMDNNNETALHGAISRGHFEVVQMLLEHMKVNLDAKDNDDNTLLHMASVGSNLELVKYLVDRGYDFNARNSNGLKPIHFAAGAGFIEAVEFYLGKGLSINDVDVLNCTLLHCATKGGNLETVKYLIQQGADVNAQNILDLTPIHVAVCCGNKDVVDILLRNGAVYNVVEKKYSKTPLELTNNKDIVNLLASTKMLFEAVIGNSPLEAQKCIKAGAVVSAKNAEYKTPLHYAAWKGNDEIVNVLLQNKADPNAVDNKGITPLHYAAKFSHFKIVKILLSNYAVHEPVSVGGKTPTDLTVDEDITNLLKLVSKAFKNITDDNSRVIDDLSKINDIDIVKSIMCACNRDNRTLVVAAIHSNFSKVRQLKEISQGDVTTKLNEAEKLLDLQQYQEALHVFNGILEIRKEILGSDNPGTFDIQKRIVEILFETGAYKEALETSEEIFQKEKEMLGLNNRATLNTRIKIAETMCKQGKHDEAFNIYREVYQKQKEVLGPNISDTLVTRCNMAAVLTIQEKYEEAVNIYKSISRKIDSANYLFAVQVQRNIACILAEQGNYEEALNIFKAILEMAEVHLGSNHLETLNILFNIAVVLEGQKKYRKSLKDYKAVLNIQKSVLGPNHPATLTTQHSIGNLLLLQGKFFSALKAYRKCFEQIKMVFGSNHPIVSNILKQIERINLEFKIRGSEPSEILQYLQKEINIVACRGDVQTLQNLLDSGLDANDKDIDGRTPLHHAVYNGHIKIVNMLLMYGADVTQATHKGNTPLHTAADKGYKESTEVLLQHVSHNKLNDFIDAKTTASGATALHVAARNGYLDVALSLLKRGAIYDITNNQGKTPLDLSTSQNVINFLKVVEGLFEDAKIGNVEIIDKLRSLKTDEFEAATHARNNQRHTLLEVLLVNRHSDFANKLVEELRIEEKL